MTDLLVAIPVALLLVISGVLTLTGSLGLLRLRTFFRRIHAPTLANTLGAFCVLMATIILASVNEHRLVAHPILIIMFLVITSPVTAMLLMRAAIRRRAESLHMGEQEITAYGPSIGPTSVTPQAARPGEPPRT
ncbi:cation:proton antiporter [Pusillimonas sp. TS35]|uniref:monovalent cation/H(+) antiporter subunit G n=1 Tax=Paracandidimonas lactea TaxID=2895524 RepID=UPI001371622C|nr:monovalent cation/H(+) antiporter subunit G [Paracandidimonas lactea]MYN11706.1 cation:proton antiporter [Pusillimonas sp. TS35]